VWHQLYTPVTQKGLMLIIIIIMYKLIITSHIYAINTNLTTDPAANRGSIPGKYTSEIR
jgi:hypothetical protein